MQGFWGSKGLLSLAFIPSCSWCDCVLVEPYEVLMTSRVSHLRDCVLSDVFGVSSSQQGLLGRVRGSLRVPMCILGILSI